jgi:hypothetical protein
VREIEIDREVAIQRAREREGERERKRESISINLLRFRSIETVGVFVHACESKHVLYI